MGESTELKETNDRVKAELEESRRRIHEINEALVARELDVAALIDVRDRLLQRREKRRKELRYQAGEITQLELSITTLSQTNSDLTSEKTALEDQNKQQVFRISQLQNETETQRSHITELTGAILHSSTIATSSRDDDYFAGEFARLTGSIRQWVLRYFEPLDAPELSYRDLSEILAQSLSKTVLAYSGTIAHDTKIKIGRKEIEAGISRRLIEHIFDPSFLFTVCAWPDIYPTEFPAVPGVLAPLNPPSRTYLTDFRLDRETQKWRCQTASMLTQHRQFEFHFNTAVTDVTEDLRNFFTGHVKPEIETSRVKALRAIVDQAARLEIEISLELSMFEMPYITPGSKYEMDHLDDRSGAVDMDEDDTEAEDEDDTGAEDDDDEEKREVEDTEAEKKKEVQIKREFIVDTVLFPPVIRWEFDEQGKFAETAIIIRKGVVTAIRS